MTLESKYLLIAAAVVALLLAAVDVPASAADVAASQPATQPGAALPPKTLKAVKALLAKAELVVLGKVEAVYDRTARDAGMLYDVKVDKILKGKWRKKSLSFRSSGWVGYAKYTKGQRVLLFLRRWGDRQPKLLQLKPVVYISPPQAGGLDLRPVEKYLKLIKSLQPGGDKLPTKATRRAKLLTRHVDQFTLVIRYFGPPDKKNPRISLTLRVPRVPPERRQAHWPAVQISKAQARRIIHRLEKTGILARAADLAKMNFAPPAGSTYALLISGPPRLRLYENAGWGLKMLECLDGPRKVLDGDAVKAMDKVLKALAPQRKKWRKEAAATQPGRTASVDAAKRQAEARADFQRLFKPADRRRIGAMTGEQVLKIIKSEKDFRRLFEVYHWCKLRRGGIAGDLVALLTKSREVGLTNSADLIIWERVKSGHLKFHGHGWIVDDDLFTTAGRASWLLKTMTGRDPGTIKMKSTARDLAALSAKWRAILAAAAPGGTKRSTKAAERAKLLKKRVDSFWLTLRWHTTQGKSLSPGQSLQLTTLEADYKPRPFWTIVVITRQRARKIIEHLAAEGFLERASDVKPAKSYPVPKLKSYSLTVRTSLGPHLYEHMPWGLNLLKRVEGLRKVMADNRDATRALDKILAPLKVMPSAGAARPAKTARDVKVRQVCMAALRKIRKDFAALAAKYPKELGHLGPGAIDEKKLLLRFPVKGLPKTTQPARRATPDGRMRSMRRALQPGELGLFVQFTVPISKRSRARWLYSNIGFSWW